MEKANIEATLNKLQVLYDKTTTDIEAKLFSKLALIETCGWIEESIDDIVLEYAERKITNNDIKIFYKDIVKKLHNVGYEPFLSLLSCAVGLKNFENIINGLEQTGDLDYLKSTLKDFKKKRDEYTHTHIPTGFMQNFHAPSIVYGIWSRLYQILTMIETKISLM